MTNDRLSHQRRGHALLDPETGLAVFVDYNILVNQLHREIPVIQRSFDVLCEDDVREISEAMAPIYAIFLVAMKGADQSANTNNAAIASLLLNSANSSASALHLLRAGFVLQPGIITRTVIEAVSTALHLFLKPKDIGSYLDGTLDSSKTLAEAKKAIPVLGQLYGNFSDEFAHMGRLHRAPQPLQAFEVRDERLVLNLNFIRVSTWLVYVATELIFMRVVSAPRYWRPLPNGFQYKPSDEELAWMRHYLRLS